MAEFLPAGKANQTSALGFITESSEQARCPGGYPPGFFARRARKVCRARFNSRHPEPLPQNAPRRTGGTPECDRLSCARLCNGTPSPTLAGRSPETTAAHRQAVHYAQSHPRRNPSSLAPMPEERSSLVIRNRPFLRWGACGQRFCAGMPGPCCLSVRIAPNGGLGLS